MKSSYLNNNQTYNSEVIATLKEKDLRAWDRLYEDYAPAIYTLILQIVMDPQRAEKVTEKFFIYSWNQINDYVIVNGTLFTWMVQKARYFAIEEVRSAHVQNTSMREIPNSETESSKAHFSQWGIQQAFGELNLDEKTLLDNYYFQGLSVQQLAEILTISPGDVDKRIKKALSSLSNILFAIAVH